MATNQESPEDGGGSLWRGRVVIDTAAPFVSVKEAVHHFGGKGHWKQHVEAKNQTCPSENSIDASSIVFVEEQADKLAKDFITKKQETLKVLKELEMTKMVLKGLKFELQKKACGVSSGTIDDAETNQAAESRYNGKGLDAIGKETRLIHHPDFILMELNEAKSNLGKSISVLARIALSIERLNHELEKEKISLEEVHQKLAANSAKIVTLEEELNQTKLLLQVIKEADATGIANSPDVARKLLELRYNSEQFKQMAEAAESEALKLSGEIERVKTGIMSVVIRLHPLLEVQKATHDPNAAAKVEIRAFVKTGDSENDFKNSASETTSHENCDMSTPKDQQSKQLPTSKTKAADTPDSKTNEELPTQEAKEGAEEQSNKNTTVEEAICKWLSEDDCARYSSIHIPILNNSFYGQYRHNSNTEGFLKSSLGFTYYEGNCNPENVQFPILSIGQILKRKLVGTYEFQIWNQGSLTDGQTLTLGQLLSKRRGFSFSKCNNYGVPKQFQTRRRRFGFGELSSLLAKHRNKGNKKKRARVSDTE